MDLNAKLVFVDKNNDVLATPTPPQEFFIRWADGDIRGTVRCYPDDEWKEALHCGAHDVLDTCLKIEFLKLHERLSLAHRLLDVRLADENENTYVVETVNGTVFTPMYNVATKFSVYDYDLVDSKEVDPVKFAELSLLAALRFTQRSNAVVLSLLQQTVKTEDIPLFVNGLSTAEFVRLRSNIWKWQLPVHIMLCSAKAIAQMDSDIWYEHTPKTFNPLTINPLNDLSSLITLDCYFVCLGSPHDPLYPLDSDAPEIYLCSSSNHLGYHLTNGISSEFNGSSWSLSARHGTIITNSHAVQVARIVYINHDDLIGSFSC